MHGVTIKKSSYNVEKAQFSLKRFGDILALNKCVNEFLSLPFTFLERSCYAPMSVVCTQCSAAFMGSMNLGTVNAI